jgi:hypothetical protein
MNKEEMMARMKTMKKEILEQQSEVISENLVGIDFSSLYPGYTMQLLAQETEKIGGFGIYVKGEW